MMRHRIDAMGGKLVLLFVVCQSGQSEGACPKMDLRVAKGMQTRGYDKVRVSVITTKATESSCDFKDAGFDYTEKFFGPEDRGKTNKMSEMTLLTTIKTVNPGQKCAVDIGGEKIILDTPAKGARTRGLFFADPCIRTATGVAPKCPFGESWKILDRFSKAVNTLVGSDEVDFWGIIGDNFYDATGDAMVDFWAELSLEAKAKPFLTVPGNHDFWNAGAPELGFVYPGADHQGYGWMQYFAQDVVASSNLSGSTPFHIPTSPSDPDWPKKCSSSLPYTGIPKEENFVFWHQVGNVASFGYSAAHATGLNPATNHDKIDPYITKFCKWVGESDDIVSWMLFGHWSGPNLGCSNGMDTPSIWNVLMSKPDCAKKKGLYLDGHNHCNQITAHSSKEAWTGHIPGGTLSTDPLPVGFMIGGSGMQGDCSQAGFLVVDSMEKDIAVDYFDIGPGKYDSVSSCWDSNKDAPFTKCRGQKWRAPPATAEDLLAQEAVRRMSAADVPPCGAPAPTPGPPAPPGPSPPTPSTGPVKAGDMMIPGDFQAAGFVVNQDITIDAENKKLAEDNTIAAFSLTGDKTGGSGGSITLKTPLKFAHDKGAVISAKAKPSPDPGSGSNLPLIIGGVVGGLAIVAVIVGAVMYFKNTRVDPALDGSQLNAAGADRVSLPPTQPAS